MAAERRSPGPMAAVILVFVGWSAWFVYRSSFVVDGVRHFSLFEDAMISMTYARNLIEGHGLNWARWGEPVEGFSCPLWTFLMIPVNASPLPLHLRSLAVQLMALALLVANLFVLRRLVLDHFSTARASHWLPAVVLTAFYYPLAHWGLMGTEVALQTLLTSAAVLQALGIAHGGRRNATALFATLTLALLLRLDMALLAGACLACAVPALRRAGVSAWLPGLALLVVAVGGYEVFRLAYFGDPLPNTFYLKLTGTPVHVRIAHGFIDFSDFARPILVPLLGVALGSLWLQRSRPALRLPLAVVALYFAYAVYIGGDVYDFFTVANRFVAPFMPMVFVLVCALLNEAIDRVPEARRPSERALRYAAAAVAAVGLVTFNGLSDVPVKKQWMTFLVFERPLHVDKHADLVRRTHRLGEMLEPDALVATSWAGLPPFFSDFRLIDFLGYNDRTIARMSAVNQLTLDDIARFDPGHMKWDIGYVVSRQPDAVYLNGRMREPMAREAEGYVLVEDLFWLRRDSQKIRRPESAGPAS